MDRRQRKSRKAIFEAFLKLLSKKDFQAISVQEIIDEADVGRATFYSHFETKDYLLKTICQELFDHILNSALGQEDTDRYNCCEQGGDIFLHLILHLQNNDDNALALLTSPNNELFMKYFKSAFKETVAQRLEFRESDIPKEYLVNHIASTFVETVIWWAKNGKKETPEKLTEYLSSVLGEFDIK